MSDIPDTMAALRPTNIEGHPIMTAQPPANAPRGPAAWRSRGDSNRASFSTNRITANYSSRGRDRDIRRGFSPIEDHGRRTRQGATSPQNHFEFPDDDDSCIELQDSAGAGIGSRQYQIAISRSSTDIVIDTSGGPSPEVAISTLATNIPQGPAWNPPKGPRAYIMHQNLHRGLHRRGSSSRKTSHATGISSSSTNSQTTELDCEQSLKLYSSLVDGLNGEFKAKVESPEDGVYVRVDVNGSAFDQDGNELIWVSKSVLEKKKQELVPPAYQGAIEMARTSRDVEDQLEVPANEVVHFAPSVDRPGWVRTTDEYMVLEFGSAGPITLRRNGVP